MVGHLNDVCRRKMLKVYVNKSKILVLKRAVRSEYNVRFNGKELELVDRFRSLGVKFTKGGNGKAEVECQVLQEREIGGAPKGLMNRRKKNCVACARILHKGVVITNMMYRCETRAYVGQGRSVISIRDG